MGDFLKTHKRQIGLLIVWIGVGALLRFAHLTAKPLWTDEFSTIVFGLGNSYQTIPLNQAISLPALLQPLQPNPDATIATVIHHLLTESNHPPLYFVLTHLWLKLFPAVDGLVSLWGVRSLSTLCGILSIPAIFGLSYLAFRSTLAGQLAAALMALSPFAIYLAQEARHYTLPIVWIIASLSCMVATLQHLQHKTRIPFWLVFTWILINGLGIATHYFFTLTLTAEALVILAFLPQFVASSQPAYLFRLTTVLLGTVLSGAVWIPVLQGVQDSELTRWIYRGDRTGLEWLAPIGQTIAGWITMLYLLPIQAEHQGVAIASIILLILFTLGTLPLLYWGVRQLWQRPETRQSVGGLGGFVGAAIALFWGITYILQRDLTSAFRYQFVYFPAVVVLMGAVFACLWRSHPKLRTAILWIGVLSLLGSLTVVTNLGYQKTHRPDLVVQAMQTAPAGNSLVAIAHRTHGQTGRLMGIGWEWQHTAPAQPAPHFLLAHQDENPRTAILTLNQILSAQPRPLNLWLMNFEPVPKPPLNRMLAEQNCTSASPSESVDGYKYQLYRCETTNPSAPVR